MLHVYRPRKFVFVVSSGRSGSTLVQGGSRRDEDVIAAIADAGAAMVFTGRRHFRH